MKYQLILASQSPRRRELFSHLDLPFEVRVIEDIAEDFPADLTPEQTAVFIAEKKARAYMPTITETELVITADTIVVAGDLILGKPVDKADARRMLKLLSHRTHQVITGVCLSTTALQKSFSVTTDVSFKQLSDTEIDYYVEKYQPLDKAGAYGIQEWIGYIGVKALHGSYFNVVGFPVQRIYQELQQMGAI
ncbi:MAG: septum formation protein Maf [Prevotella sp.]|nr:septum formation protein Maf [Prevotella sp.]